MIKYFPNNINSKKNILILFGDMRTYKYTFDNFKNSLLKLKPTIIISTWTSDKLDFDFIINKFQPIIFDAENYSKFNFYDKIKELDIVNFSEDGAYSVESTYSMAYKFRRTAKLINYVEKKDKLNFEKVIRYRPDLLNLSLLKDIQFKEDFIFENVYSNINFQLSDRFFYAKKKSYVFLSLNLLSFYKKKLLISDYSINNDRSKGINRNLPIGERLIFQFIKSNNFTYKFFLPAMDIWRKNAYPTSNDKLKIIFLYIRRKIKIFLRKYV